MQSKTVRDRFDPVANALQLESCFQQYEIPDTAWKLWCTMTFNVSGPNRSFAQMQDTGAQQNKALVFARNLLLPRLMNGEIKV